VIDLKRLEQLQLHWDDLAEIDPMWAICSDPDKQYGGWDIDDFLHTGCLELNRIFTWIEQQGLQLTYGVAVDFGCGIGRVTQPLAERFAQCYGVDISPRMIELAKSLNCHGDRVTYIVNDGASLIELDDVSGDFVYSSRVLQHVPSELIAGYIAELIRILNSRGALVFQVPTRRVVFDWTPERLGNLPLYHPKRLLNALRWHLLGDADRNFYALKRAGVSPWWLYRRLRLRPRIEMNPIEIADIEAIVSQSGARIVSVYQDRHTAGSGFVSSTFLVVKSS
jgi:SAM-dependent methyltransferase